jgi:hypothetical protein
MSEYIIPSSGNLFSISTSTAFYNISEYYTNTIISREMSSRPGPKLQHIPLPSPDPTQFVHLITSLLTPTECAHFISSHTNLIPSNIVPGTIRTREQFEDTALAEEIWERIRVFYEGDRIQDEDGEWWRAKGLNHMFRLCKYERG